MSTCPVQTYINKTTVFSLSLFLFFAREERDQTPIHVCVVTCVVTHALHPTMLYSFIMGATIYDIAADTDCSNPAQDLSQKIFGAR